MIPPPSRFTLFPYTSLFRSWSTVVLLVKPEIVHPTSLYSVKLIVPVGLVPRVRCATSDTCPPAATEPLAVVESAGAAFATTNAPTPERQSRSTPGCRLLLPQTTTFPGQDPATTP